MNTECFRYRALSSDVLAVCVINLGVKDWSAYIGAVPGKNHDQEYMIVARRGEKLPLPIAKYLFPDADENYRWRD